MLTVAYLSLVLAACASTNTGQPQPDAIAADRLKRVEDAMVQHGTRIDGLRDRITDDRFGAITAQMDKMEAGAEKNADEQQRAMMTSMGLVAEQMEAISKQLQILTIIISSVAGGGILGAGGIYKLQQKKPVKADE